MKLEDVKDKIDAYFSTVDPKEIVKHFESLGYQFEDIVESTAHDTKVQHPPP